MGEQAHLAFPREIPPGRGIQQQGWKRWCLLTLTRCQGFPGPPEMLHEPQKRCVIRHQLLPSLLQAEFSSVQFSCSLMSDSLWPPWTAARQPSLSITNSQSLLRPMSTQSVMPFSHLTLCHPLLLLPSIFPSIRVFSNEFILCIRWPKYWSFSFNISPSNE